ncbi:winged helix-turn-helix domain-containing protein [Streptomyces stelliscabiei]|uniref:winged helix-turn-helix domain-containing protein n=1 Tax=Streptomyces stelliscabiei TaxID=146820 RepID=UPI0029BB78A7|nr:winged helix-turn-helix domain-containing protein [Streptomyces stelliscabiei]MDX2518948.1 winged helix-turn-helix domain-containing protein [Streptomyces stelliscabiei]MDX2556421.1 winged helix-turn-helix domain-containing protein [Streptomyces stelliscabiei]MDX2615101.1 winged helix-turn-helix domain-containing protein [Streptomyces stelliscabiei]MDX2640294.1 winged helix-turn-helix domain-containing protein [Streptomyces stelliscabiei]MDX2665785.1 winged helix-turn-helix domain-containin
MPLNSHCSGGWRRRVLPAATPSGRTRSARSGIASPRRREEGCSAHAHPRGDREHDTTRASTTVVPEERLSLSVTTAWRLLKRHGWSWRPPAERLNATNTPSNCGRRRCGRE